MKRWLLHVALLTAKEWSALARDAVLVVLIAFAFTAAIVTVAHSLRVDVDNTSIAVIDDDHSQLSARLREAILPPRFKRPVLIERSEAAPGMDAGHGRQAWTPGMDVWAQERKLTEMLPMDSGIWAQTSKFKIWTQ